MKYTNHAREKMNEYGISEKDVKDTGKVLEKLFLDVNRLIGVKKWSGDKRLSEIFGFKGYRF